MRIAPIATDENPALKAAIHHPGQRDARPVVEPQSLGALAGGMRRPRFSRQFIGHLRRIGLQEAIRGQHAKRVVRAHRQDVRLAARFEHAPQP